MSAPKGAKSISSEEGRTGRLAGASTSVGCGLYFIGFIGAAVYYIGIATTFWNGLLGFLQACVWPAFLVHGLMRFLAL